MDVDVGVVVYVFVCVLARRVGGWGGHVCVNIHTHIYMHPQ